MFNLPNNTPYVLVIEADSGFLVMSSRWGSNEGNEMGPMSTFACFNTKLEALAAVETFLASDETD
jgi:hypothetical protein